MTATFKLVTTAGLQRYIFQFFFMNRICKNKQHKLYKNSQIDIFFHLLMHIDFMFYCLNLKYAYKDTNVCT